MEIRIFYDIEGRLSVKIGDSESTFFSEADFVISNNATIDIFATLEKLRTQYQLNINIETKIYILDVYLTNRSIEFNEVTNSTYIKEIDINLRLKIMPLLVLEKLNMDFSIQNGTIQKINLVSFSKVKLCLLETLQILMFRRGHGKILTLSRVTIQSSMDINEALLGSFEIVDQSIIAGTINIYLSSINNLIIKNISIPKGKFLITNSTIKSVFLFRIDINGFELTGIQGKGFCNLINENGGDKNDDMEMKEYYRKLKYMHDEHGNKIEANKFFAKEMEYYEKSLTWKNDFGKKLISSINRYINDYGNNWWLPLIWIIVISFLYTLVFSCPYFNCSCGGVYNGDCFSLYWLKNLSQFPTEIKNVSSWSFLFYALIMGALIYQFLVALRRISQR